MNAVSRLARRLELFVFALLAVCFAAVTFAQTPETGAITGRVADRTNLVSNVKVQARSDALPGVRTSVTDAKGRFRLAYLPPGRYAVSASAPGSESVAQREVTVALGRTVRIELTLHPALSQEITVAAVSPTVDVTSTIAGVNVTPEAMRTLPLQRAYTAAAEIAPGTRNDAVGAAVYGSSGAENQYVIDGLNVTQLEEGISGKALTLDFVQELEVMTGGLPAEYGRATGGIINAVTRSGSNDIRGDVFGYVSRGGMFARPKYLGELSPLNTSWWGDDDRTDWGADAGGPIVRDRLWAFGAYDRVQTRNERVLLTNLSTPGYSLAAGSKVPWTEATGLHSAKLTFAATSQQTVTATLVGDPRSISGAMRAINGPPTTWLSGEAAGADDYVARYSGIFGAKFNLNAVAGWDTQQFHFEGPGASTPLLVDRTVAPQQRSGGLGLFNDAFEHRTVAKADSTAFLSGGNAFKFGADQERETADWSSWFSGGSKVEKICSVALVKGACPSTGFVYYRHTAFVNDLSPNFDGKNPATFAPNIANPLISLSLTVNRSAYVQDSWTTSALTVNAGLRYERQVFADRRNMRQMTMNDFAPRLGVVWDPLRNGRSRLYAFAGRYFESVPLQVAAAFGSAPQVQVNNFSADGANLTPDAKAPAFPSTRLPYALTGGSAGYAIDPHVRGQYLDEYIAGYDRDLGASFTGGLKFTFRNMPRILEDMSTDGTNGGWIIANPGQGAGKNMLTVDGESVPAPKPVRRQTSFEVHASRRWNANAQFFASYVWSRLYGNYEGLFKASTYEPFPNISSAYDYADFLVNAYGPLPADRTHQLKAYGSYEVSRSFLRGLTAGVAAHWYSGTPLSAQGLDAYYYDSSFLTPRGSLGRGPSDYEADLHLGYPLPVRRGRMELLLDVFNVLNRQAATELDPDYNTYVDGLCGGVPQSLCNPDSGTLLTKPGTIEPVGKLNDPRASAPNPHFLKANAWTPPRQIRLGMRMRF